MACRAQAVWIVVSDEAAFKRGSRSESPGTFPPDEAWEDVMLPYLREKFTQRTRTALVFPDVGPAQPLVQQSFWLWRNVGITVLGMAGSLGVVAALVMMYVAGRRFDRALVWRWKGLCARCGYGVRGLAECPECGRSVEGEIGARDGRG